MKNLFFAFLTLLTFAGCGNYVYDLRGKFDESLTKYNNHYRWNEVDAVGAYIADPLREESLMRIKATRNVKIVDSRILGVRYDELKRKADVDVEIEYYFLSSTKVKTLRDTQQWVYKKEFEREGWFGRDGWRVMSLPPEFK